MKFIRRSTTKNEKAPHSHIPFRLNFLFVIVFILFAALIIQLARLQIVNGPMFEAEVNSGDVRTETTNVQRGMIYDSTGKLLAANDSSRAITYTKPLNVSATVMYQIANDLTKYISVEDENINLADEIDYYLANPIHEENVKKKIANADSLQPDDLYKAESKYVKQHNLQANLSGRQKQAAILYSKMNGAYSLSTVYLKTSDVTDKEMAEVGENLSKLPGIKIGTSWKRSYPNGESVKSVIGTVTTEKQGLPSDSINTLLAQGYSRNDSVGSSYIESKYEDVLKGTKAITDVETQNGSIVDEVEKYGGKPGDNLVLTINSQFQNTVQQIMEDTVNSIKGSNPYLPGAYAVVMNPNTGAIYALAGVNRDLETGKVTENALGAINQSYVMGSVVKGATVISCLLSGVITPQSNTLVDEPIKLKGTPVKSSVFNRNGSVALTASDALMVSSNAYMMKLAMLEGGFNYVPGAALSLPTSIFDKLRGYFKQFGLGVKTGIDIPGESTGFEGPSSQADIGKALDLSFGHYDSYTTLQLAQYASTIANGGYRMQPHILESIRETNSDGSLGSTVYEFTPNVLNVVPATNSQWKVVKDGFWKVVHGTSPWRTGSKLQDMKPSVSAKTGNATIYHGTAETEMLSLVSYAPSDDAKVVIALAFPGTTKATGVNTDAAKKIYEAFWSQVMSNDGLE